MLETYTWPNVAHPGEEPGSSDAAAFRPWDSSRAGPGKPSLFEDLNDLFRPVPAHGPKADGLDQAAEASAALVQAARSEGMEAGRSVGAEALLRQSEEVERLGLLLTRQQASLMAHRAEVDAVADGLIGALLDVLGQGRLRIDENAWREALGILRRALAPGACKAFSSCEPIPAGLFQDGESTHLDPAVPPGEVHATDGQRTLALSLMDLAQSIKTALVAHDARTLRGGQ